MASVQGLAILGGLATFGVACYPYLWSLQSLGTPESSKDGGDFHNYEVAAAAAADSDGSHLLCIYHMPVILNCFVYATYHNPVRKRNYH